MKDFEILVLEGAYPSSVAMSRDILDASRLAARLESALPQVPPVSQLARELCVSERTLARHVRQATGKTPLAFIQGIRVQRARALLHDSRMSIEQVAVQVGYQDATALRKLMRKATGVTPARFRASAMVEA